MDYIQMGERLKTLRITRQLTLKQVSELVGVSISMISAYEVEDRHPSYLTLLKLSRLYGVTCDYLISGNTDNENKRTIDVSGLSEREIANVSELVAIIKENKNS